MYQNGLHNDVLNHCIFENDNLFSTLFLFPICIFAYFIVDNHDKYQFYISILIEKDCF